MLPVNSGGHAAYQTFVLENLRKLSGSHCFCEINMGHHRTFLES